MRNIGDEEDIAERLRTQDNRCTAEPMFCLQIKVRDVGYETDYTEGRCWTHDDDPECIRYDDDPDGPPTEHELELWDEHGYKDRWETVMVAFTERGLKDYMMMDGHNVTRRAHNGETRIYVETFRRCDEMIRIRKMLLDEPAQVTP
jgi:hypothetical protein